MNRHNHTLQGKTTAIIALIIVTIICGLVDNIL